ncbi:Gfo/Idh/MocA family protein [Microbacterium sp. NPDC056234]|uniref:Gfo/Idh/MocA family protein n=1 Tax=Microbacterium sp. NPDC056234 TaxID=3345757 RepID=UPI0035D80268
MSGLRVGLIGAGGISRVHADAWRTLGAHATVTSRTGAEDLAAEYGMSVAPDVETLLADVDIVDIVTPSATHAAFALAAIEAGVHVICEKPLAPTAAEAQRIVDAAAEAGVRLFPAHVVRYFPEYVRVKAQVDARTVGEVMTQRFLRMGSAPSASWFFQESTGGGVIRDLMIHDIDQALWLAGPVTTVSAVQHPPTADDVVPVPVTARVVLSHASGARSDLQATWGGPGLTFRTGLEISGRLGTLAHDSAEASSPTEAATTDHLPPVSPASNPYLDELADFVAAIDHDADARVSGADGVAAIVVAEAAYASIASGATVTLPAPLTPAGG